jgi:mRNA interferase RelE/StbE
VNGYRVEFSTAARRELEDLPAQMVERLLRAIRGLRDTPRPRGSKKLVGSEAYRIRVGQYRVVYEVNDTQRLVLITRVRHRKDVYD